MFSIEVARAPGWVDTEFTLPSPVTGLYITYAYTVHLIMVDVSFSCSKSVSFTCKQEYYLEQPLQIILSLQWDKGIGEDCMSATALHLF